MTWLAVSQKNIALVSKGGVMKLAYAVVKR